MPVTPFVERGTLKTKELGESKLLNLLFKPAGLLMGSRFANARRAGGGP